MIASFRPPMRPGWTKRRNYWTVVCCVSFVLNNNVNNALYAQSEHPEGDGGAEGGRGEGWGSGGVWLERMMVQVLFYYYYTLNQVLVKYS